MSDVNNLANGSLEFTLSGKVYKVKRLNIMDLFGEFEADVKKQYMDDIIELASRITDPKERIAFQREAIKDVPKGKTLEEAVRERMDGFEGGIKLLYLSLSKCNKINLQETRDIVMDPANQSTITNLMTFITGGDQEEKVSTTPEGAIVLESEKKM